MDSTRPGLSIVLPVYNERQNLEPLQKRITEALAPESVDYEVIYVDDGSTDGSWEVLKAMAAADPRVRLARFRRNFGQTAAMAAGDLLRVQAGRRHARRRPAERSGRHSALVAALGDSYDVVAGWRRNRHDKWLSRRLPSMAANRLIRWMTGTALHDSGCTLRAYRREIIQDVELYGEMHRFLPMLAAWVGARITEIEVTHHPRIHGKSKYGALRIYKVFMDLLTLKFIGDFSARPNYVFGGFGLANLILAGLTFLLVAYRTFMLKNPQATPMIFMMIGFLVTGWCRCSSDCSPRS
jgi:glycosyltransferase involved in cell wall biosynthesis